VTVSISNLVAPLITEPTTWLVGPIASTYKNNETFEVYSLKGLYQVDANGNPTTIPLGTSGPFVLKVDNEQILCSSVNYSTNHVSIYSSASGNGRGYASTTIAKHETGSSSSSQVSVVSTSVQGGAPMAGGTVTLTSGTAVQNTNTTSATYYVAITGATAGTVSVSLGSTSATSTNVIPATSSNAVSSQVIPVDVPSGWWIKVTTTTATINPSTVIINNAN
jgi:hypothetical protein